MLDYAQIQGAIVLANTLWQQMPQGAVERFGRTYGLPTVCILQNKPSERQPLFWPTLVSGVDEVAGLQEGSRN